MLIGHYKRTPIAYAPEAIVWCINKYTSHQAYVFGLGYKETSPRPDTDIVHIHNKDDVKFPKKIIQYHSEPFRVDLNVDLPKLVIAQYHATLPEYKRCTIVRNPVDFFMTQYMKEYTDKKIRIGYSPSSTTPDSQWADKGYAETTAILRKLKKEYGDRIDIEIIVEQPLAKCLELKLNCNIFIDEVKTGSYHRSGLESLGMGIFTICHVSDEIAKIACKASGADNLPFRDATIDNLEPILRGLIESGLENVLHQGIIARKWMEKYWHPETIANEYISIYEKII